MVISINDIRKCIPLLWIFLISASLKAQEKAINAFYFASEIVADSKGNLFVVGKGNRIIKITPDGNAWHFAGHVKGYSQEKDGNGANAMFTDTRGIAIDEDDNLYITDYNTIRKVTPGGTVSKFCGNLAKRITKDGDFKTASFHELGAITSDKNGTLYVTDEVFDSSANVMDYMVRKITANQVTTIRYPDGTPMTFHYIYGLACDNNRNLLVAATAWSSAIIKVSSDGIITTLAGVYDANGKNAARFREGNLQSARLIAPYAIAVNKNNEIFFSDNRLNRILKIANNQVTVVAGGGGKSATGLSMASGATGGYSDGKGIQALLHSPHGITFDKDGNLFIVDNASSNAAIRKLSPDGMVTTFCRQEFNPATKQYETVFGEKKLVAENKNNTTEPKNVIINADLQKQIDEATTRAKRMADSVLQKGNTIPTAAGGSGNIIMPSLPSPDSARIKSIPDKIFSVAEVRSYLAGIHARLVKLLPADAVSSAQAIEKKLGNDPNKLEATALIAWQKGAYEESLLLITSVGDKAGSSTLLMNAGSILDMSGLSEKAIPVLRTVIRIDPQNAAAQNNLGQAFTALGMQDSALHYFSRCLSLSPQHPEANNTAGYIELKKGNKDKAQAYFENSIRGSFNVRAYNGLLSIKKDYQINKLIRPKVKIPEYFNELKYKLPRQCINTDLAAKCRKEHEDFKTMIWDLINKHEALRKEAEQQFASQGIDKIKNNALQKKKVLRPFQLLGYVMGIEITNEYLKEKGELDKFDKDIKRQYGLLEKQYQDELKHLFDDYGGDGNCCGEGNTSCCIPDAVVCKAVNGLRNKYLPQFAQLMEEKQIRFLLLERKYFDEMVYWNYISSYDDNDFRRRFHGLVTNYLTVLSNLAETKILDPCGRQQEKEKGEEEKDTTTVKEPECPFALSIRFWVGKLDGDCEKISFKAGEGLVFRYERNFIQRQQTISLGVGADLDKYEAKGLGLEAGIDVEATAAVYVTFDLSGNPTDGGLIGKVKAKAGVGFESGQKLKFKEGMSIQASINTGLSFDPGPLKPIWDKIHPPPETEKPINKNVKIYQ